MRLDPQVELTPFNMVPLEAFTSSDHTKSEYLYYQSEYEKTICGVWKCAPCLEVEACPVEEFMTVISGVVKVTY